MKKLHLRKHQAVRIVCTLIILLVLSSIIPVQTASAGNDTWTNLGLLGASISAIAVNPNNPQELLAGISGYNSNVIYRSTNGGTSWVLSNSGLPVSVSDCGDIAYDVNNSNIVYAATGVGMYKSLNSGLSWQQVGPLTRFGDVEVDPTNGNIVYARASNNINGVLKTIDGGSTWVSILDGSAIGNFSVNIKVAPSAPYIIYVSTETGLYKSIDSGQTWKYADGGFY